MKAQSFTMDLLFGMLLITVTVVSVIYLVPRTQSLFSEDVDRLNLLMAPGVPQDWNDTTVIIPGFLTDGRFNKTKIDTFESLDGNFSRNLLGVQSTYTIRFYQNGTTLPLCTTCGFEPTDFKERLTIARYAIYNGSITQMEVQLFK